MKTQRTNNIKVVKNPLEPETPEVLAASIILIGESMKKLAQSGGLTDDALATLIVNLPGNSKKIGKAEVLLVIEGLNRLSSYYIRK